MKRMGCIALLLALACGRAEPGAVDAQNPPADAGTWSELPAAPLAARWGAHALEVDGKLLVVGGTSAPACPPNADCMTPTEAPFDDGAVYDPATESWSEIARAPAPIGYALSAVVRDRAYFLVGPFRSSHPTSRSAFLSYDVERDEWAEHDLPPNPEERALIATGEHVIAYQGSQENGIEGDYAFDPTSGKWAELPADPLRPAFDRSMVWTPEGLVLVGLEHVPNPGAHRPSLYRAALFGDDRWRRLPDSEIVGYNPLWSWTGGRVLNAAIESADGGETNNWGRSYPAGGMLDPATGEWSRLPEVPDDYGPFTGVYASNDRFAVAGGGWVLDTRDRTWLELTRPPGGPEIDHAHAWVGNELFVWGGVRYHGDDGELIDGGWRWIPDTAR
jgi:hypothetical protein